MKKLIVFAITCLMGINVVAMEEDFSALSSVGKKSKREIEAKNKEELYICFLAHHDFILRSYPNLSLLRSHEYKYHRIETFVCMNLIQDEHLPEGISICLQKFPTKDGCVEHRSFHKFFCHLCYGEKKVLNQFTSIGYLNNHICCDHGEGDNKGPNACLLCDPYKRFIKESDLYQHLKEEHDLLSWPDEISNIKIEPDTILLII